MRTLNRFLAPLAALALIAVAVLLSIEVVAAGLHHQPALIHWHHTYQQGRHNIWRSSGPLTISAVLLAIGVVLLAAQLTPRRATHRTLSDITSGVDASISSKGLCTALKAAALSVDGVATVNVALKRRTAAVTAKTHGSSRQTARDLAPAVETATRQRLEDIGLAHAPRLRVTVAPGKASA